MNTPHRRERESMYCVIDMWVKITPPQSKEREACGSRSPHHKAKRGVVSYVSGMEPSKAGKKFKREGQTVFHNHPTASHKREKQGGHYHPTHKAKERERGAPPQIDGLV